MIRILYSMIVVFTLSACVTSGVTFQNVNLGINDGPIEKIRGLLATPAGKGPFPAVVLLHTCGGVTPHVSEDWPAVLNANGYAALTVDTFGSRNAGRCPEAIHLGGIAMARDAYGALDYLAGRPDIDPNRIGVMGFSLGAMAVEGFATAYGSGIKIESPGGRNFKAGIAFYGECNFDSEPAFPILAIIGDLDTQSVSCPGKTHAILGVAVPIVPDVSVEIIPGATHAFDNTQLTTMRVVSGGHVSVYDWNATRKARKLTQQFLDKHLAK